MKHHLLTCGLVLLVGPALSVAAAAPADHPRYNPHTGLVETPLSDLRKAAEHGDRAELGRRAARIGTARLAAAMAGSDHSLTLAVLDSLPYLPSSPLLIGAVVPVCESSDARLSERALTTLGLLLSDADPDRLDDWEVPAELRQNACTALTNNAARIDRPVAIRLAAIQSLADAGPTCAKKASLVSLLRDTAPEIRRAALLTMAVADERGLATLRGAENDPDPMVAAAAGSALCRQRSALRSRPGTLKAGLPSEPTAPWRALIKAPGTPAEDAVEMLSCLAGSADPADAKAIEELHASSNPVLRDASKTKVDKH